MKIRPHFDFAPRLKPLPHQLEATNFLVERGTAALFDEQGLGKTKIVIDALSLLFAAGTLEGAIVVCRKSLLETWQQEIAKHSSLRSIVLRGTPGQKGIRYMWFAHFYLINYDLVPSECERLQRFLVTKPMALVLDESQRIKNPEGKATQAVLSLSRFATRRYIITGTPIANAPLDLWTQAYFLDEGDALGKTPAQFSARFQIDPKPSTRKPIDEDGLAKLRDSIAGFSMRRLKADVLELPTKTYQTIDVALEVTQRKMYDQLREQLYLEIVNLDGQEVVDDATNILKRMLRLVQIASNPQLIDSSYAATPAKFARIDKLIDEILAQRQKVIVWTGFVDNVALLRRRYAQYGSAMIFGDVPVDERQAIINRFQTAAEPRVLIANPAAAREGLTLTAANHAIYLDRNFNLVDYIQSQDRIHRIGQSRPAFIYKIVGLDTIDSYIESVIYRKQTIAQYVYGDTKQLESTATVFTKEDALELLGASDGRAHAGS